MTAAKPTPADPRAALVALASRDHQLVEAQAEDIGKQGVKEQEAKTFRILGWCSSRINVFYQSGATGQIASVKPAAASTALLPLAPIEYWRAQFPKRDKNGDTIPGTVVWDEAASYVIQQADAAGVFSLEAVRGRGVWLDRNNTVVWHLGDRLVIDGKPVELIKHVSHHHYHRLPALPIDHDGPVLTDQQGKAIAHAVNAMGWVQPVMPVYALGWAVISNVAGAVEFRPALQVTAPFGSGKTDVFKIVLKPLTACTCLYEENSTEAGVRQTLGPDTLPVLIDESELEDPRKREGHVRLARYSFNGTGQSRGTTHGKAIHFNVRSSIAMAGINTTLSKGQDQSRIVVVAKAFLPQDQWLQAKDSLQRAVSPEIGEALIRRTVLHFHTLQKNIATFKIVIAAQFPADVSSGRFGDTYGALLAGYHLLISTAQLTPEQALAFLDQVGWSAQSIFDGDNNNLLKRDGGGMACLEHLLAHELPWKLDEATGRTSVRELIALTRKKGAHADVGQEQAAKGAVTALARLGMRADRSDPGLFVSGEAVLLKPILGNTQWREGEHTDTLRSIPNSIVDRKRLHGAGNPRGTTIPWNLINADWS